MKRIAKKVESWLGDWTPEIIICHTMWPAGDLASRLAKRMEIPWVGIVHGHDFDVGLEDKNLSSQIIRLVNDCDHLVTVSSRLHSIAKDLGKASSSVISCHTAVEDEWLTKPKKWQGRWRKSKLDILFPADPRRREKNHFLALQTGEELENRGWVVGITTLRQQPRTIVWDRMLVANLTLITSTRESGPLVARESLVCGTPVVSVNVGEVSQYLSKTSLVEQYDPIKLADACENALQTDWSEGFKIPNEFSTEEISKRWSSLLAKLLE
jgi:glycosyltransferase involved in cell wall biosynthesis